MNDRFRRTSFFCLIALWALAGCEQPDPIRQYTVERLPPEHRMWGAIVPRDEMTWFFKVSGPNSAVAARSEAFRDFLRSVRFEEGTPTWTLPEGWERKPADRFRFATLQIPADEDTAELEMSVSQLGSPRGDPTEYLLQNINRWRGQLGLGPLPASELERETSVIELAGDTATVLELEGTMGSSAGPMGMGGMAGRENRPRRAPTGGKRTTAPKIAFETPAGWEPGELVKARGGISIPRAAAFLVKDGGEQVEVTVTSLPVGGDGGEQYLLSNVNRWRRQLGLRPISVGELELEPLTFASTEGDYVEIVGPREAILGVIAIQGGGTSRAWFAKMQGSVDLALRERDRFKDFIGSIQFKD